MNDVFQQTDNVDKLENFVKPAIYSKRAIWCFSVFFTPLFGGILLMQNLKDIDKKKEANLVLLLSILMTVLVILPAIVFDIENRSLTLIWNIVCATLLTEYFYKKYFPDERDYEKKKVWKPLIIGVIIVIFLTLLLLFDQDEYIQ